MPSTHRFCELGVIGSLVAILIASGCSKPAPPNVVLVTIDTLRADRLGSYGHQIDTSPFLDDLASQGVRFQNAYSESSWTTPSIVSLLTSLRPTTHGIESASVVVRGQGENQPSQLRQQTLPRRLLLWPQSLKARGYRTFGITANGLLKGDRGFRRGFDHYKCIGFGNAEKVEAIVRRWKRNITRQRPYFLWLHFIEPHGPYNEHPSVRELYGPRTSRLAKTIAPWQLTKRSPERLRNALPRALELYDGEIRHTDGVIARIFDNLGISSSDLVIVTSDHGEEFFDHGNFGHASTLYEEVVRVPLIIRFPGALHAGRTIDGAVRLIDVLPTVLEVLGIAPVEHFQGRSLLPLIAGKESGSREVVATLHRYERNSMASLTQGDWKYIHHDVDPASHRLFNLARDPGERSNLLSTENRRAQAMAAHLSAVVERDRSRQLVAPRARLSEAQAERLRALGYLPETAD